MNICETVGANIRKLRKQQKLSQEELAQLTATSRSHLSLIENGHKNVGIISLAALAAALNVKITDLFSGYK